MSSFKDILKARGSDIEAPKPVPVGTYRAMIDATPAKIDEEKGTVTHGVRLLSAEADVDQERLAEFGGVSGKVMFHTIWLIPREDTVEGWDRAKYRAKMFYVEALGLPEGDSLEQWIAAAPGQQCLVSVSHAPAKSGDVMYANIAKVMKAE